MACLLCETHGATTFVEPVCSHIADDVYAARPVRHFNTYFLGMEGFPGTPCFNVPRFCDDCVKVRALPETGTLIPEEFWDITNEHRYDANHLTCYACFEQYAQQEIPRSFCKIHVSSDIVRVCSHIADDVRASRPIRRFNTYFVIMDHGGVSPQCWWFIIPHFCEECVEKYALPGRGALLPADLWDYEKRPRWNTSVICEGCFKKYARQEIPTAPIEHFNE